MKAPQAIRKSQAAWLVLLGAAAVLVQFGLARPGVLAAALGRMAQFGRDLFPPRVDVIPTLSAALLETVQIAFAGTVIGTLAALPIAWLAARNLFGAGCSSAVRMTVGALRAVPSILLGVLSVVAFGLGPLAGVFGVSLYTVGYLAKLYYEAFEAVDAEVLEAVRSTGGSRLQLWRRAVLPEAMPAVISQALFMFEYNIRASAIMGFVGAGGIGYYMLGYAQMLQYRALMTAMLMTFIVVMVVDRFSLWLRRKLLPDMPQAAR
jgi:phosphonate transport system permease protein